MLYQACSGILAIVGVPEAMQHFLCAAGRYKEKKHRYHGCRTRPPFKGRAVKCASPTDHARIGRSPIGGRAEAMQQAGLLRLSLRL